MARYPHEKEERNGIEPFLQHLNRIHPSSFTPKAPRLVPDQRFPHLAYLRHYMNLPSSEHAKARREMSRAAVPQRMLKQDDKAERRSENCRVRVIGSASHTPSHLARCVTKQHVSEAYLRKKLQATHAMSRRIPMVFHEGVVVGEIRV